MKISVLLFMFFLAASGYAQTTTPVVEFINPPSVGMPKGYSQAAVVDLGEKKMLIISGQVALDKQNNLVGAADIEQQARQVFTNIKSIVEASGGTMNDIVKLGYFIRDAGQIQKIRAVRDRFINISHPPASTLVEVSKLYRDDILIEIEATAIISKK